MTLVTIAMWKMTQLQLSIIKGSSPHNFRYRTTSSKSSLAASSLLVRILVHCLMSKKFRTHLDRCPSETAWSHVAVSLKTSLKSRLHLAVRGISMPLMSKTPICLLVICLLVSFLGTNASMSVFEVVLPPKVLVLGGRVPHTTRPKCRGWSLSSTESVMGCHVCRL